MQKTVQVTPALGHSWNYSGLACGQKLLQTYFPYFVIPTHSVPTLKFIGMWIFLKAEGKKVSSSLLKSPLKNSGFAQAPVQLHASYSPKA